MPLVLHSGFGDEIGKLEDGLSNARFKNVREADFTDSELHSADVVLLGPLTDNVLKAVQTISRQDSLISTLVLADEDNYQTVKQSLLFTPFVSKSARILRLDEETPAEITKAATLTKQRRNFAKITASIHADTSEKPREKVARVEALGGFLEQAPIGAIIINSRQHVVGINSFARRLFNIKPLQAVTKLTDMLDTVSVNSIVQCIRKKPASKFIEVHSGNQYFEIHFAEVTNDNSDNLEILLITDITERKLELQRIRAVLDSLPQMAWTANVDGEVTYFTKGWYTFTGQSYGKAMGEGWAEVLHPDDREWYVTAWKKAVAEQKLFEEEARYRRADGEYQWHLVRGVPLLAANGNVGFWLGTCTDIEDQKRAQQLLAEKVDERTRELVSVNELLQRSNNDLKEFAYVASHDLKEPIRKIKIFLERSRVAKDENAREDYLNKVESAAKRMTELIDGIMAYSQVSGGFGKEEVDLNEVVQQVISDLEMIIREKEATFSVSELPVIRGLKTQLGQLFANIILNSLKYNKERPVISISAQITDAPEGSGEYERTNRYLELVISDNGIGFDKKYTQDIFVMFKRLHNRDEYSGAGIGLALVKKIVDNHNGFIKVESEPGKGAKFLIYLPV